MTIHALSPYCSGMENLEVYIPKSEIERVCKNCESNEDETEKVAPLFIVNAQEKSYSDFTKSYRPRRA
ncbi:hypothetical protein EVAR_33820_1 [Eumeta japonica]|uniref:Uncharacterized protein n=1 Tax=Eumeta variegata TaxID=151549 RepID=A0A4C1V9P5_EUMVA|nr:hypothetical protein EVAR_33820_1 [Eumeta japonica]